MIHLESWHRESVTLTEERQQLLEMLERELITPEEFALKWKRLVSHPSEGWLQKDEHGRYRMTTEWMQAHSSQIKELLFRKEDHKRTPPGMGTEALDEHNRSKWYLTQLVLALSPGHYLSNLPGYPSKVFTESGFNAYVEDVLKQAREWDRRIALYQMEHPSTP